VNSQLRCFMAKTNVWKGQCFGNQFRSGAEGSEHLTIAWVDTVAENDSRAHYPHGEIIMKVTAAIVAMTLVAGSRTKTVANAVSFERAAAGIPVTFELAIPVTGSLLDNEAACVVCVSEGCQTNYHWATADGPLMHFYAGPHTGCLANPTDPSFNAPCDGHLSCASGFGSIEAFDNMKSVAARALTGSAEAIQEFASKYPGQIRLNKTWNVLEITGCLKSGALLGTVGAELAQPISKVFGT
jgi:hypothetical protein